MIEIYQQLLRIGNYEDEGKGIKQSHRWHVIGVSLV